MLQRGEPAQRSGLGTGATRWLIISSIASREAAVSMTESNSDSEVPQPASLRLGLPTLSSFRDGFIRPRDFPSHPPMPQSAS